MSNLLVFCLLLRSEFSTTWFLVWHRDVDAFKRKADKSQVLQQFTAFGQRIGCVVSNRLVVPTAFIRIAQKRHLARLVTKQHVLHGVTLFLAAIVRLLLSIVVWAGDRSFRAIVIKRGAGARGSCCSA